MRKDMKRVLITRPRVGGLNRSSRRKIRMTDLDEHGYAKDNYPKRLSAKRDTVGRFGEEKHLNDLMGPIRRYLLKQVGRPWDDVWSEVCKDNKDYMGKHLKDHILWEVETKCHFGEDGKLYNENHRPLFIWRAHGGFYVDPNTGILKVMKPESKKRKERECKIVEMDGQEYYKHEGVWYRVKMKELDKKLFNWNSWWSLNIPYKDVFGNGLTPSYRKQQYVVSAYGKAVYCVWKQQANSKECKRLNALKKAA